LPLHAATDMIEALSKMLAVQHASRTHRIAEDYRVAPPEQPNPHKRSISRSFHENDANCHSFSSCADILTIVKRALSQNEVAADSTL
jgi:hypothetical protein